MGSKIRIFFNSIFLQVALCQAPTNCALPLSPIFVKTFDQERFVESQLSGHGHTGAYFGSNIAENSGSLLDSLDEITSLPQEFLTIGNSKSIIP